MRKIALEPSWLAALESAFADPKMQELRTFLETEIAAGRQIYPKMSHLFRALDLTPLEAVRVVIVGQDPYHGPGQAEGLAFSVPSGVPIPPSLRNIYQELQQDLGIPPRSNGSLVGWAQQGVLLLNTVLSVAAERPGSHRGKGWECFTDAIIARLNRQSRRLVFVLWGREAAQKASGIDTRHLQLRSPHPSPLSAHRGFFGSKPFSQINAFLASQGEPGIHWEA